MKNYSHQLLKMNKELSLNLCFENYDSLSNIHKHLYVKMKLKKVSRVYSKISTI